MWVCVKDGVFTFLLPFFSLKMKTSRLSAACCLFLFFNVVVVHGQPLLERVCRGSVFLTDHKNDRVGVVRQPLLSLDPFMCSAFWGRSVARDALELHQTYGADANILELASIDGGVVTYRGPSRQFANHLVSASKLDPHGLSDLLSITLALIACALVAICSCHSSRLSTREWRSTGGILLLATAILLRMTSVLNDWSTPQFPALEQFEQAIVARSQTQTHSKLDTCLHMEGRWAPRTHVEDATGDRHHHWFTARECMCAWHHAALNEVATMASNNNNTAIDIRWFQSHSVFRAAAIDTILAPHKDQGKGVSRFVAQVNAAHHAIEDELSSIQTQMAVADRQLLLLRRPRAYAQYPVVAASPRVNNASLSVPDQIEALEWRIAHLATQLSHTRSTKQMPHVRRLWASLQKSAPWFKLAC